MENNSNYVGRGIHKEKFLNSLKDGNLKKMLEVIRKDKDLDIQIRNNYLNIYYKGGNIAKVKSESSVEFDKFYFYLDMKKKPTKCIKKDSQIVKDLEEKRDLLISKFKEKNYESFFNEAKCVICKWLSINPKPEREEQHKLTINNKYNESDYTIIDLEYQVSIKSNFECKYFREGRTKPLTPRFDIIAVNKEGKLCVIELKKGKGALKGNSGLKEHWECYKNSINRCPEPFVNEMKKIIEQKQDLGLLDKNVKILCSKPEFIFAFIYDDKEQKKDFENELKKIEQCIKYIYINNKDNNYKLNENYNT